MMNDLAEAMREAAEILHEIGGYSALVDDLRYGAAELEAQKPFGHVFYDCNGEPYFVDPVDPEYGEGFDVYRHPPSAVPEGWKPIETAPKDGTTVLLRSKYGSHGDGYWLQSARDGLGAWVWPYLRNEPWFWMPLPAAPGAGGE